MPALLQKQSRQALNRTRFCRRRRRQSTICYSFCNMRRPLFLLLTVLTLASAALPAAAQNFQPKNIQFKGDPEYSDQELLAASGLKKGASISSEEMNHHFKLLTDSGVFSNLGWIFNGVDVIITLAPSEQLYPIRLANIPLTAG